MRLKENKTQMELPRSWKRKFSGILSKIEFKFAFINFLAIFCILSIVFLIQTENQHKFIFDAELGRYSTLTKYLATQMSGGVRWNKKRAIELAYEKIAKDKNSFITNLSVYGKDGKVIHRFSQNTEESHKFPAYLIVKRRLKAGEVEGHLYPDHYTVTVPVVLAQESQIMGWLSVAWSLKGVRSNLTDLHDQALKLNAIVGFLSMIILLFALFIVSRRVILRPLNRLTDTILNISDGNIDVKVPETHRVDEIGKVAQATEIFKYRVSSAMRVQTAFDSAASPVVITDEQGVIRYVNGAGTRFFKSEEDIIRKHSAEFNGSDVLGTSINLFSLYVESREPLFDGSTSVRRLSLSIGDKTYQVRSVPILNVQNLNIGSVLEWVDQTQEKHVESEIENLITKGLQGDFTQRINLKDKTGFPLIISKGINNLIEEIVSRNKDLEKRAQELHVSEERYALAAQGANDGLWDWDLETDEIFFSSRWKEILGLEKSNKPFHKIDQWMDRVHKDYKDRLRKEVEAHLKGHTPRIECEYKIKHENGKYCWVLTRGVASRDEEGKVIRIAGSQRDISETKCHEEELFETAFYDPLTKLPNRALFLTKLEEAIVRMKRYESLCSAVMFLDLDRFKVINDSQGHTFGDELLVQVAERLKLCLRPGDTVSRLGGDEFSVLVSEIETKEHVFMLAERILESFETPFSIGGKKIFTSTSIGITLISTEEQKAEDVIRDADLAMYEAKNGGKARYVLFDDTHRENILKAHQVESDLRQALKTKEIVPYYQPIMDLKTGEIVSFEALVRWNHPERGLIAPGEFIELAEETNQIIDIGRLVLQSSSEVLKEWFRKFGKDLRVSVSVNLSINQLREKNVVEEIVSIIEASKLPSHAFKFEVTESVIMDNPDIVLKHIERIKSTGIQLSIDDFGTGYSSLSYLCSLPFDILKIDRSFVSRMTHDEKTKQLVASIIDLSHGQGLEVVAEGIETAEELKLLQKAGGNYGQGYYFSKPIPEAEATAFLVAHTSSKKKIPPKDPQKPPGKKASGKVGKRKAAA